MEKIDLIIEITTDEHAADPNPLTDAKTFRTIIISHDENGVRSVKDIAEIDARDENGEIDWTYVADLLYIIDSFDPKKQKIVEFRSAVPKRLLQQAFRDAVNKNPKRETIKKIAFMKTRVFKRDYREAIASLFGV